MKRQFDTVVLFLCIVMDLFSFCLHSIPRVVSLRKYVDHNAPVGDSIRTDILSLLLRVNPGSPDQGLFVPVPPGDL